MRHSTSTSRRGGRLKAATRSAVPAITAASASSVLPRLTDSEISGWLSPSAATRGGSTLVEWLSMAFSVTWPWCTPW
ncbi:MAG: hypothetical protein DI587_08690 [Variovorax paradoxus]|nr:MAG: hypothetical protein DI583_08690 [Variovorax paradoxus]PZQ12752.1 MAG: hypothetical protein DI587_08690 [Variovorax paradoxus]